MPLDQVRQEMALRLQESQLLLSDLKRRADARGTGHTDPSLNALKGLFFVSIYSCLEYCVSRAVVETSQRMRAEGVANSHLSYSMYPLALDPQLVSVATSGNKTKWRKRHALFATQRSDSTCDFDEASVLKELGNIWCTTIRQLFEAFDLGEDALYDVRAARYIDEVVDNRNKVAHGRESAGDVGRSYSMPMLESRLDTITRQIEFVVSRFETLVDTKGYINPDYLAHYPNALPNHV